jgi:probable F420-dependent oxidoreductase
VRFGLALPHYDFSLPGVPRISFRAVLEWALRAEALGFHSVWVSDHFFLSLGRYGGPDAPRGSLEPLTSLAALAAATSRVRLGTLVVSAPFRHPAIVAKMATTADLLSGGRLELGVGAGWYEEEFRAFGYPFGSAADRFGILEETLEAIGRLFAGGPASVDGGRFRLRDAVMRPRPAQSPRPPIWLGSKGGRRSLRIAARLADGWNTVWRWEPREYAARVDSARAACEREGRDPSTLRLSIGLYAVVGEDERDARARLERLRGGESASGEDLEDLAATTLSGTPERALERVRQLADLGVEEIIVAPGELPFAIPDAEMVEVIAERVVAPGAAL